jgi:hypothetical protein
MNATTTSKRTWIRLAGVAILTVALSLQQLLECTHVLAHGVRPRRHVSKTVTLQPRNVASNDADDSTDDE